MSEFLYDKAIMALKAQRYDEAQASYEQALQVGYSVEAWTGLGICKLFQIAEGQTMEEVLFCFEKARKVEGADNREIDLKLLQNGQVVILQCAAYAIASINNAIEAEKKAATAALISIASIAVGGLSNSIGTKIFAGAAAATAAGVAVGQFGKMTSSKEIAKFATDLLEEIYNNVYGFLLEKDKMEEAVELKDTTDRLCSEILDALDPNRKKARESQELIEAQKVAQKEEMANQTDESVVSLANSFQELGVFQMISFLEVTSDEVLQLIKNDNFLFCIKNALNCDHYFCEKGVVKTGLMFGKQEIYYSYSELSNLEKSWGGALRDKPTGYKIDINKASVDWQSPIIDFINSKRHELSPESKNMPGQELAIEEVPIVEEAVSELAVKTPLSDKYLIPENIRYYGGLIQKRQSEVGFFKKDRYKKIFIKDIIKEYDVKFMDWGNLAKELKEFESANSQSLADKYSDISVE